MYALQLIDNHGDTFSVTLHDSAREAYDTAYVLREEYGYTFKHEVYRVGTEREAREWLAPA